MPESWTRPAPAFPTLPSRDGLTITEITGRSMATVVARNGGEAALRGFVEERFGLVLPDGPRRVAGSGLSLLGLGPGKWLAVGESAPALTVPAALAAVVDQGGAYGVVAIAGPDAQKVLAAAVAIDLDPLVFVAGSVATTQIEHIGVTLVRVGATPPSYELYVVRSYAGALAHWLGSL